MAGHQDDRTDNSISFKDTLNLPKTDFPMRAESQKNDPLLLKRWEEEKLATRAMTLHEGNTKYILHDGPPYANGHIHLGHAYNKILKDIITKSYRMSGYHVPVRPGWDCHGLPIEHKVTQMNPELSGSELKAQCRKYAQEWVTIQKEEFKKLGVLMNWDHPYLTMSHDYEAKTIECFGKLYERTFIERKNKTVAWCMHCKTVLAAAEIEYQMRKDPSIYVLFELVPSSRKKISLVDIDPNKPLYLLIWTTTPWTLPLNRAVLRRKTGTYDIIRIKDKLVLIGSELVADISKKMQTVPEIIAKISTDELKDMFAQHPFIPELIVPIIADDSVSAEDGTAFVHCAPGCGPIDYEIGVKHGLEIFAPISATGNYTEGINPQELKGMSVTDGQIWVIKKLNELDRLLYKSSITHSYPHCWRCHNGLIFRATKQWFFNLQKYNIKDKATHILDDIAFYPTNGRNFLRATLENRWEWCLSRQRAWGVPIPAVHCKGCDYTYTSYEFIMQVAKGVRKEGVEYWDRVTISELLPEFTCPMCSSKDFIKEKDILDVWFDAGISHQAVLAADPNLQFPADLYLEGIDQHRGWFQSSLLTSMALTDKSCTKGIMTHGFTVDAQGQKMSKSLGNVVSPDEIIAQIGTDGLRLWVASIGNDGDAVVSDELLANMSEVFRKIRNTCRGLLMNLFDFNYHEDVVTIENLQLLDRYMLHRIATLNVELIERYHRGDFSAVIHKLTDFCAVDISSFYLEIIKDRLYCDEKKSISRRSAQTVIWYTFDALTRLLAPIMSFTSEWLYHYQGAVQSIHKQKFVLLPDPFALEHATRGAYEQELSPALVGHAFESARHIQEDAAIKEQEYAWEVLREIRSAVLKAIEPLRAQGLIKQSMEAAVTLYISQESHYFKAYQLIVEKLNHHGEKPELFFKEFFVVSQVILAITDTGLENTLLSGIKVKVEHAPGIKCPRCWQWDLSENIQGLCHRCARVLHQ